VEGIIPYCFRWYYWTLGWKSWICCLLCCFNNYELHSITILYNLVDLFLSFTDQSFESTKLIVSVVHWVC
jgi:hypothetical protein